MNISSSAATNSGTYALKGSSSSLANPMDREIQQLMKLKSQLQEQIHKTTESNMDMKEKQLRIKDLKSQLQEVDSQIKQKQTEKLMQKKQSEEVSKQEETNANPALEEQGQGQMAGLNSVLMADLTYTKAQVMSKTKSGLERELRVLNKEIKQDADRGYFSSRKSDRALEIEGQMNDLDKSIGEALGGVQDNITESTEQVEKESEASRTRADEEKGEDINRASQGVKSGSDEESEKRTEHKSVDIRI